MSPDPTAWFAAAPRDGAAAPTEPGRDLAPPVTAGSAVNWPMLFAVVFGVVFWAAVFVASVFLV